MFLKRSDSEAEPLRAKSPLGRVCAGAWGRFLEGDWGGVVGFVCRFFWGLVGWFDDVLWLVWYDWLVYCWFVYMIKHDFCCAMWPVCVS